MKFHVIRLHPISVGDRLFIWESNKVSFKLLGIAAAAALIAAPAMAVTYATDVVWKGTQYSIDDATFAVDGSDRNNAYNVLGEEDGSFLSLGLGEYADFTFGTKFTGQVSVFEITFGARKGHDEYALVTGFLDGQATVLGLINNQNPESSLTFTGVFDMLRIRDVTIGNLLNPNDANNRDGFDIDAVSVSAVPLPAGAALLLGGLGALGVVRGSRKKA